MITIENTWKQQKIHENNRKYMKTIENTWNNRKYKKTIENTCFHAIGNTYFHVMTIGNTCFHVMTIGNTCFPVLVL